MVLLGILIIIVVIAVCRMWVGDSGLSPQGSNSSSRSLISPLYSNQDRTWLFDQSTDNSGSPAMADSSLPDNSAPPQDCSSDFSSDNSTGGCSCPADTSSYDSGGCPADTSSFDNSNPN